ncbi:hypothetical protein Poli38472_014177 [Pythium oligandrum]|uniref:FYVE-type domain-containing protein n=1 Tax=Pythium oligandrum TaxID=41045 RepID=A0A8K1CIX4_PYTOL|nr:hypothetical protein Poli38472_014177 [Pythium oligandrum]|eukprot:TMW64060.1 hypothetical protein Poli38472_014177 [Pythium oligandrum]
MKLQLTADEENVVIHKTAGMVEETLSLEQDYRRQRRIVDTNEWKQVAVRNDFHIYKQRKEFATFTTSRVPGILCAGTVDGKLEDFMYGVYDGDETAWRIRSAYNPDKFAHSHLLATIVGPSSKEPFRHVGVRWLATQSPPVVGAFIQERDYLLMEASGMARDKQGETYGYYVLRDFVHPNLPVRRDSGFIRCKFSFCCIARQLSSRRVAVYARSNVDFGGYLPATVGIPIVARTLLAFANSVETSHSKKLTSLIAQQQSQRLKTNTFVPNTSSCHSCEKKPGYLTASLVRCQACHQSFCANCSTQRKLVVDVTAEELTLRTLPVCYVCVDQAKQLSSVDVARPHLRSSK